MSDSRIIAGIDIGSSKVCTAIAQVHEDTRSEVNIIGVSTVQSRGIRKGQIVDIVEAAESILDGLEAAQRMAGYQLSSVYVSVGGSHIVSQNSHAVVAIAHPEGEITREDVDRVSEAARAITLPSSREIIHVIPRMYIVDGQDGIRDPVGMAGIRLEVDTHLIHGTTINLKNLTKCINDVKLDVESFVFSGLASSISVLSETEKELGVAVIDIGGGTTDICVYVDGALSHSAVLPVGARNITNDIAIGLRVSLDVAEKIKLLLSRQPKLIVEPVDSSGVSKSLDREARKKLDEIDLREFHLGDDLQTVSRKLLLDGIIKPRLEEIFSLVAMEFKKSGFHNSIPAGVVLCGGGAQTVGLMDVARKVLGLPARIGSPVGITGLVDELNSPAYATVVGLLLYGADERFDFHSSSNGFSFSKASFLQERGAGFMQYILKFIKKFLP